MMKHALKLGLLVVLLGCPDEARFNTQESQDMMIRDQSVPVRTPDAGPATDLAMRDDMMMSPDEGTSMDSNLSDDSSTPDSEIINPDGTIGTTDALMLDDANTQTETCTVAFRVTLPEGTTESPIYLAGNFCQNDCGGASGVCCDWIPDDPQFRETVEERADGIAYFSITVPPNVDIEYKYTRGTWDTVERLEGCREALNRLLRADCPNSEVFMVNDVIDTWSDNCD